MARSSTTYQKGKKKTGGRVAGTPNKVDLKDATLRAFDEVGGCEYLKKIALQYPTAFLNFVGRFVAKDIQLSGGEENNNPLRLIIKGYSDRNDRHNSSNSSPA